MARTSTYLNFSNNTEEAFTYYQAIFGGEFVGGIARFGEIPPQEGMPPMAESEKNLVMHIELHITGGHAIMGTDAPESMGFTINKGNNMHLNLELDTREECERIFAALSSDGQITMPLQDMFWGAYYGSCTDKFDVQWMVNCNNK